MTAVCPISLTFYFYNLHTEIYSLTTIDPAMHR